MIVLIDPESNTITICGEISQTFDLADISSYKKLLKNKKVMYVTSAEEMNGNDIIESLADTAEDVQIEAPKQRNNRNITSIIDEIEDGEETFIHSTRNGTIICKNVLNKDKTNMDDDLKFEDPYAMLKVDDLSEMLKKYPSIRAYIKKGILKITKTQNNREIEKMVIKDKIDRIKRCNSNYKMMPKSKLNKEGDHAISSQISKNGKMYINDDEGGIEVSGDEE